MTRKGKVRAKTLEDYRELAAQCLRCSMCKWIPQVQIQSQRFATICPAIDRFNFHSYSGGGRIVLGLAVLMGRLELAPGAEGVEELVDILYKCTECGGCDVACKYLNNLEPVEIIQALREKAVEAGVGPLPVQRGYIENAREFHNPYGEPHAERLAWLPDDVKLTPGAKVAFFVGCTSSYRRQEIAIATARVLAAAGVEFTILGGPEGEFCCGSPLLRVGARDQFLELADHNIAAFHAQKVKTVITSCAGCYSTLKADYPLYGRKYKFKVLHAAEFFLKLLKKKKLHLPHPVNLKVTYHDPCHLGRASEPHKRWFGHEFEVKSLVRIPIPPKPLRRGTHGIYDAPREVLARIPGLEVVEMERIREYSYCCGAGGGVKSAFPEFAVGTAQTRVEEAEATGADTLASCCPFCSTNLQDGIAARDSSLAFYDLSELLLMAIDPSLVERERPPGGHPAENQEQEAA